MYTEAPISNALEGLTELRIRYQFGDIRLDPETIQYRTKKLDQARDAIKAMQTFIEDIRFSLGDFTAESFRSLVEDAVRKFDERMKSV